MKSSNKKGQSIIEVILALSMLTIGFLGILTLLSRSFFLDKVTADELTATYLASEGLEITKNFIDHDTYAGTPWGTCSGACAGDGSYIADYTSGSSGQDQALVPSACPGPFLRFNPVNHVYNYTGSVATNFQRCIRITHDPSGNNSTTVISRVTWSTGAIFQSLNLEDHFYRWNPKSN